MSTFLANFHLLRPWWLLALAALPLLWLIFSRRGMDPGAWRGAVDAHLLKHLLETGGADAPARAPRWLAGVGWALACLALAGPAWERLPQPLFRNQAARVIALELASTMSAQDIKPSRFERARFKIDDILQRSGDMQTALIAYAGAAFVVAPLTDDTNTVSNLVDALDPAVMPKDGNDTARAIDLGVKLVRQAGLGSGEIILLVDDVSDDAVAAARRARTAGVRVFVLGVSSAHGAPVSLPQGGFLKNSAGDIVLPKLDAAALAAVAQAGGGRYATVSADGSDLDALLDTPTVQGATQSTQGQAMTTRFLDRGPWLLLLLLPLAAFGFRRGWLMLLPLVLLAHSPPAAAFSWNDLWQRPDQQARSALDAGQAQRAQTLAQDPALRGAAAYRADDFKTAAQDFADQRDAQNDYNRGNALAKQGQYEKAIAAYDSALARAPEMADALANKKAVEDWLKQQQQNKQQQKNSQNQQGSKNSQDQKQDSSNAPGDQKQDQHGQEQKDQNQQGEEQGQQDQREHDQSGQSQSSSQNDQSHSDPSKQDQSQQGQQKGQTRNDAAGQQDSSADAHNVSADAKPAQAQQQAQQQAQKEFAKNMNQAIQQGKDGDGKQPPAVRLGAHEDDSKHDEHQQAVEQWLQRVPDDPGGLLRRKFQLEYQIRQHQGDAGGGDGQ